MSIMTSRKILFEILLDDDATGMTLITGAPIHSADDFLRARRALDTLDAAPSPALDATDRHA